MSPQVDQEKKAVVESETKRTYEPPAIIYKGVVSTRAGSPISVPNNDPTGVDPADLFGD